MSDYLEDLDLSDEERSKLRALGARTPLALLAMRKASASAFDLHLGSARAPAIVKQLQGLLSEDEVERLNEQPKARPGLGARLTPAPDEPDPASE